MTLVLVGVGVVLGLAYAHWRQIPVVDSGERAEVLRRLRSVLRN